MRYVIAVALIVYAACCYGQELPSVCIGGCPAARKVVVRQNVNVSAQEHAETLAATGTFGHCGRRGGGYEGIGQSPVSPEDACRRCCFWGQRRVREIGTAWCPRLHRWIAVVRYE